MKRIICGLIMCFLIAGCGSSASAKEIYIDALTYMNENIFYYKAEEKGYMHEEFSYIKNTEILVDEKDIVHSIIENKFDEKGNGITTVSDGKDIHRLEIDKDKNMQEYMVENKGTVKKEGPLFYSIFEDERTVVVDSKVEKKGKEKKLIINCTFDVDDKEVVLDSKYIITIKDNYINEIEYFSYPFDDGILSEHRVIKYMDFNATKNIDTSSVIKEMAIYKK